MNNTELIESIESILSTREDYLLHKEVSDFVEMYFDNFPSLKSRISRKAGLRHIFDIACEIYGLDRREFAARLVFDPMATVSTMELALWGLNNFSPLKLSQLRVRYYDPKRRETGGTIVSEVTYVSLKGTHNVYDTTGLSVNEIIEVLGKDLL